jgi:hypothetical protein
VIRGFKYLKITTTLDLVHTFDNWMFRYHALYPARIDIQIAAYKSIILIPYSLLSKWGLERVCMRPNTTDQSASRVCARCRDLRHQ